MQRKFLSVSPVSLQRCRQVVITVIFQMAPYVHRTESNAILYLISSNLQKSHISVTNRISDLFISKSNLCMHEYILHFVHQGEWNFCLNIENIQPQMQSRDIGAVSKYHTHTKNQISTPLALFNLLERH